MLKKIIVFIIFCQTFLISDTLSSHYQTQIKTVNKDIITVQNNRDVAVGSTGIVLHQFDKDHQTIIAKVEVVSKINDTMMLKLSKYLGVKQDALPSYNITPQIGDKVILNFLYNRALAIVPNINSYKMVTRSYDNIIWVHPDIFAAKLSIDYTPAPTKKEFQEICSTENIALLFFHIDKTGYFIDCNSFVTIDTIPLPTTKDIKLPFYTRINNIKSRFSAFGADKGITDYNNYYKKLLGIK
jgi:hypothetical protein